MSKTELKVGDKIYHLNFGYGGDTIINAKITFSTITYVGEDKDGTYYGHKTPGSIFTALKISEKSINNIIEYGSGISCFSTSKEKCAKFLIKHARKRLDEIEAELKSVNNE